ncbi:hypothetical protein H072_4099 [Dactylellina haptotyla CBS 200.50]|uniref:HORMA domain-containing protein n=1 Tax=Dactylellina haptotyla (strain CBS 200.50) TaxID=1284197 RepID=S8AFW0_DACHA|nr:hypothetical protein H072_4099 [Dactylellina haptotyla CBS 200.50]
MTEIIQNGETCALIPAFLDTVQLRRSVKALIRKLILVTQNLDLLPETRYLTIRLYHTPETPDEWVPPMFTPFAGKPLRYDGGPHKSPSRGVFGRLDTGIHSVQVRIASTKRTISETQERVVASADNQRPNKRPRICGKVVADKLIGLDTALEDYVVQPDQSSKIAVHKPDILLKSQSVNEELKNVKSFGQAVLGSRLQST